MARPSSYPPAVVEFARRLGERGYKVVEIQAALAKRGYRPHEVTVAQWADPDYADARNIARRRRRIGRLARGPRGWEVKLERLRELHDLGLSYRAVALVVNHDFDLSLTRNQVQEILTGRTRPSNVKALLAGEAIRRGRPAKVAA